LVCSLFEKKHPISYFETKKSQSLLTDNEQHRIAV
jgi:hypothetical protein